MQKDVVITKSNGDKEVFNPLKLENSLLRAGARAKNATEIAQHITRELKEGMSTSQIYKHAFFLLHKSERPTALRYSLKRAIIDLGPSGFPFENFIAEIFKNKGFTTETGRIVKGACVDHEIDVVAYNENKLIMVEAKFHNELGVKSDLKVALYVKARYDDLEKTSFFFGKERKLDEGWLVTNTKFTSTAIQYDKCQKLKLIGWNYPEKDNLQNMIEDAGLHPLTCLTTLSTTEKHSLLKKGIVLCRTLLENPEALKAVGIPEDKISHIKDEISLL